MENIPFNVPTYSTKAGEYMQDVINGKEFEGDGNYTFKCSELLEKKFGINKLLLTTSCTHALEIAALLLDIQPGDEVIMPSFTFVSTANAFLLRGAKIVFVDIRPDTCNIDENLIEQAITKKTKAIIPVHYAGLSSEMDTINAIAKEYGLTVIEDAAQGVNAFYKGKALGTIGDIGCYSFHATKNYSMGEGGALILNRQSDVMKAQIMREKGTNRTEFLKGLVNKYTWVDKGSSYLPSDILAALLFAQLEEMDSINELRVLKYKRYRRNLSELADKGYCTLPFIPSHCKTNGHIFYIKTRTAEERTKLREHLKRNGINSLSHYVPLHSSFMGMKYSKFIGQDKHTTDISMRLLRLPMYHELKIEQIDRICTCIEDFFLGESRCLLQRMQDVAI